MATRPYQQAAGSRVYSFPLYKGGSFLFFLTLNVFKQPIGIPAKRDRDPSIGREATSTESSLPLHLATYFFLKKKTPRLVWERGFVLCQPFNFLLKPSCHIVQSKPFSTAITGAFKGGITVWTTQET